MQIIVHILAIIGALSLLFVGYVLYCFFVTGYEIDEDRR